ncbi:recombinase family protein [Jeotgalibacillus haloalkalitolerans]|uniref:Recombinase family protein n=1 Tax=Jeotgalibacillus haloalkalitolerans TaxID=3104292 RepID=A0ABU5KP90_9BACL|nr:recombinase family protein [Jeotgalibacillus sp. HH7-29]MDZ5712781.1 recombinase family protein [Jeotgalibacillus sp. HH7-29]
MEREIKKVAVYVRKSREEETEDTLNRQQSVLIDLCEKNQWEYELFKEVGSSQEYDRPQLQEMLENIRAFMYDGIVIADLDRLSRNTVHFGQIKEIIVNSGVITITPSKTYDFSKDDDDFISDVQSVLSKQEYKTIKRRLVRGTRQSAKDGNWLGKKAPIGYKYNRETKRLEPSEDAHVIQRMFQEYIGGKSTKDIAYEFDLEGVTTSVGMIWTPAGVTRMLSNIVYAGHSLYGRTTQKKVNGKRVVEKTREEEQILVENTHEALVSQEDYDEVQRIKKQRNSRPVPLKLGKHKFSGLIRCGICGRIHSFQTSKYKRKRISSCQTRNYNGDKYVVCSNKGANVSEFEKLFYAHFKKYVDQIEEYVHLIEPKETNNEGEIQRKETQVKKLNQDIKRVQQGFLMEIFTEEEAHEQIKGFKSKIEELENDIERLKEQESFNEQDFLKEKLDRMKLFLTNGDDMEEREANMILQEFVETIIYTKTDNEMELNIVMKDLS